ncbi:YndM family protein [Gottfriedia luciferensis]|uniref:YndM family protein n=1 Tax=Gottfriedia luciferensis TaxID=178774 RepID=UPI000B45492E|nr:YndM family protein [Gottfriedia luciferensis]
MKHIKALIIKFIASLAILYIVLGVGYDMAFRNVFMITLVLGIISYIIGDLLILPKTNNTIATIADAVLAFVIIWYMGSKLTYGGSMFKPALISAIVLGVFEYFFHKYVYNHVINHTQEERSEGINSGNLRYQTEASEELTPYKNDNDKK